MKDEELEKLVQKRRYIMNCPSEPILILYARTKNTDAYACQDVVHCYLAHLTAYASSPEEEKHLFDNLIASFKKNAVMTAAHMDMLYMLVEN